MIDPIYKLTKVDSEKIDALVFDTQMEKYMFLIIFRIYFT